MAYKVTFSQTAIKALEKLEKRTARLIQNWILKNLIDTDDPKQHGKFLKGKLQGAWRYRVGNYRIFADINDKEIQIQVLDILHRQEAYKKFRR